MKIAKEGSLRSMFPRLAPLALLSLVALAGCGETTPSDAVSGSTTPAYQRVQDDESPVGGLQTPVRIGELGPNFPACSTRGTTRRTIGSGDSIPVRAAPFDNAETVEELPAGSGFFICSRSLDQKWFGIVFAEGDGGPDCGVTRPVSSRRDYEGPCRTGWVPSVAVKTTAT
jgi:hypothetical protein